MSHKNLYDLMEPLTPERKARVLRACEHEIRLELQAQGLHEKIKAGKVEIHFAPSGLLDDFLKEHTSMVEKFFRVILGKSFGDVLITDESSLYDFVSVVPEPDEDSTMYHARRNGIVGKIRHDIRRLYQIPIAEEIPNKLIRIFYLLLKYHHGGSR